MTPEQYSMFARLFDAAIAAWQFDVDCRPTVVLHGAPAGAALRYWGTQRKLDVVPDTLEDPSLGSWTVLRVAPPGDSDPFIVPCIVVHLRDYRRAPRTEAA